MAAGRFVDGREFAVAVGATAAVVAAASAAGRLTGGRSAAYQSALNAFGLHGLVHLAQAALVRGCTPGSATPPARRRPVHPPGPPPAAPGRGPARRAPARPRRGARLRGRGDGRGARGGAAAEAGYFSAVEVIASRTGFRSALLASVALTEWTRVRLRSRVPPMTALYP
ncbi:hypothetical protein GCM10010279_56000 [Streptomyces mutabilis]|nr:hypothetical protein GCM10010279_56000 [Streptomyces mutabilis]